MAAQKLTCPNRSDDFENQFTNNERHDFFTSESRGFNCLELSDGSSRSFKDLEEPSTQRFFGRGLESRRILHIDVFASGHPQLYRGKKRVPQNLESLWENTTFPDLGFDLFEELNLSCYVPEKEEAVLTIDSFKKTEEKALDIDNPPLSQYAWEQPDANSLQPQADYYKVLSPNELPHDNLLAYTVTDSMNQNFEESFDINSLLKVLDVPSDQASSWPAEQMQPYPLDTQFNVIYDHNAVFINADSVDLKIGAVIPGELDFTILNNAKCNMNEEQNLGAMQPSTLPKRKENLSLDVTVQAPTWPGDVSTSAILNDVMALKQNSTEILDQPKLWPLQGTSTETFTELKNSSKVDYELITPKSESLLESDNDDSKLHVRKRSRQERDDYDETYTSCSEQPPRKYKRRKNSVPVKDLLAVLESQPKVRRGRPPKRRESTVSSMCSVDDNSSCLSTQYKFREQRDRNNEASKRSRMKKKIEEQQMEELLEELQEENKTLRAKVVFLEWMIKKMYAMLDQCKNSAI